MGAISATDIISIIQSEIENFDFDTESRETGEVIYVGDGIATIYGIDHAMYGEIVVFDNGVKGMVQDIRQNEIGVILFGRDHGIHEGTKVVRTKKKAGIPVGEGFIGRIINALGEPIDGKGDIKEEDYRPIENEAPGIVDRKSVDTPLETGILSIDSMFPIGRGQRELIIGDRQTGKTSIATDTIINQKGKDVICIYVAIGQKASTVAKIVSTLTKHGAMDYSIVLSSTASDPASLQYIAPYAGTAMAEHFMHQGKDVLIVYDDLSKHAVAYRALSLLLERSPGREAYPGDVFYLHSRLLERSSRLSDELGGGSITALPIIETQAGDVSAYIPTNVISITDGQIFLESNLFNAGMRPAVNVGLSVSRVGGAAQTKAMKKASGSILAQYREMEVFTQFASDLDDATKAQLAHGKALMELLKQPLCHPLSLHEQVMTLIMANNGVFDTIETKEVKKYQGDILSYMDLSYPEIGQKIEENRAIDEELVNKIMDAVKEYPVARFFFLQNMHRHTRTPDRHTKAVCMICSSKVKRAEKMQADTEPDFFTLQSEMSRILRHLPDMEDIYFKTNEDKLPEDRKVGYIVITADKGLAGSYNHNILKMAEEHLKNHPNHSLFVLGELGRHYFEQRGIEIEKQFHYTVQNPTLNRARNIAEEILELYLHNELDEVYIIYTSMINAIQEETQMSQLLPLKKADFTVQIPIDIPREELALKPSPEAVMDRIVPNYVVGFVYGALVESFSCEQNARMMAMQSASNSARDMLAELDILYNRARQAAITQEITEVIAGAKSQKKKRK